jgi:hypothetical protein
MIKNIEFKYSRNVHPEAAVEAAYKNAINHWLSEFISELNDENSTVEYWITAAGENRITFKNISPQLYRKVMKELARFDMQP